jgi:glycosyltransferase involved in cell wall biosynthesis
MGLAFAVIGRNEAATLENSLAMARDAARAGERVVYVDSWSSDGSPELAASLGYEVIRAPAGKGRAVAAALRELGAGHVCLLDADIWDGSDNLALGLRRAHDEAPADMIVADFDWPEKRTYAVLPAMYWPLLESLFPEAVDGFGPLAIVGFRIVDAGLAFGELPRGYGVEVHMNIVAATRGFSTRTVPCGTYHGPVRDNFPELCRDIAGAVLTLAEADGRLHGTRGEWDAWVGEAIAAVRERPAIGEEAFQRRVGELKGRRP